MKYQKLKELLKIFKKNEDIIIHVNVNLVKNKSNAPEINFEDVCYWYNSIICLDVSFKDNTNEVKFPKGN